MLSNLIKNSNLPAIEVAKVIEDAFVGSDADMFRGWRNLVTFLDEVFAEAHEDIWQGWPDVIRDIRTDLGKELKLAGTWCRGNPLGGQFGKYPVAACLLEKPVNLIKRQYRSLCILLVHRIISTKDSRGLQQFCIYLRIAANPRKPSFQILESVPVYKGDIEAYRQSLVDFLKTAEVTCDTGQIKLLRSLRSLTIYRLPRKKGTISNPEVTVLGQVIIAGGHDDESDYNGNITSLIVKDDDEPVEDGHGILLFEDKDVEEEGDASLSGLVARARRSRYWVRRHCNLTRFDREILTGIEKNRLSKYLVDALRNESGVDLIVAIVLAMAYTTPLTVDEVVEAYCSGEIARIAERGSIEKHITIPENAFVPEDDALQECEAFTENYEIPILKIIAGALRRVVNGSVSGIDVASKEVIHGLITEKVNGLCDKGRYRITKRRINAAIKNEVTIKEKNPLATFLLAANESHASPILAYYASMKISTLVRIYVECASDLLGVAPAMEIESSSCMTKPIAKAGAIRKFVDNQSESLLSILEDRKAELWEKHNAFVDYCVTMLMYATWHRPVRDPFESLSLIDLDTGLMIIDDKYVDEMHKSRIVGIPDKAVRQLKVYLNHLAKVRSDLAKMGKGHFALAEEINRVIGSNVRQARIPLFFYLDRKLQKTHSVKAENIKSYVKKFSWFPANFGRHIGASAFLEKCCSCKEMQIQLGHLDGVDHPFGKVSEKSAIDVMEGVKNRLNEIMDVQGWRVINPYKRGLTGRQIKKRSRVREEVHENEMIGSSLRAARREGLYKKASDIVRHVIEEHSDMSDESLKQNGEMQIIERKIVETASKNHIDISKALLVFYRWQRARDGHNNRRLALAIKNEKSPFDKNTLLKYQEAKDFRAVFIKRLEDKGRGMVAWKEKERIAEIVVSAAVLGGLAVNYRLKALVDSIRKNVFFLKGDVFVDLPLVNKYRAETKQNVFRWFADDISAVLIIGYYRLDSTKAYGVKVTDVEREIKKIIKECNGMCGRKTVWNYLADLTSSVMTLESPGYVRAVATGKILSASLPLASYARIVNGGRLVFERASKSTRKAGMANFYGTLPEGNKATNCQKRTFLRDMREAFNSALKVDARGAMKRDSVVKRALREKIIQLLKQDNDFSQIEVLLGNWVIYLCESGTRFKRSGVRFSTARKYFGMVAKAMSEVVDRADFISMNSYEYEKIYMEASDYSKENKAGYLIGRLAEFHAFVADIYSIDDPEWSEVYAYAGETIDVCVPDANIITKVEYNHTITYISRDDSLSLVRRQQYCFLLICGYRFGLRYGEAFKLQARDIQHSEGYEKINIIIRNNIYGDNKTHAGNRVARCVYELSKFEKECVESLVESLNEQAAYDYQQALMAEEGESRVLIDRGESSRYINQVLKTITGDELVRFHHLRHSYVNNVFKSKTVSENIACGENVSLRGLAVLVGHTCEETTITSYLHSIDRCIYRYSRKQLLNVSSRFIIYATGLKYDAIRKRFKRRKENNRNLGTMLGADKCIPSPDVQFSMSDVIVDMREINDEVRAVTVFNVLSDIKRVANIDVNVIGNLASKYVLPQDAIRSILACAKNIERLSGFVRFSLQRKFGNGDIDEYRLVSSNNMGPVEHMRIRKLLARFDRQISAGNTNDIDVIKKGLKVWARCYHPASRALIVTCMQDVVDYNNMIIGLSDEKIRYHFQLPHGCEAWVQDLKSRFGDDHRFEITKNLRQAFEKTEVSKKRRIKLSSITTDTQWVTNKTLALYLFVLSIYVDYLRDECDKNQSGI